MFRLVTVFVAFSVMHFFLPTIFYLSGLNSMLWMQRAIFKISVEMQHFTYFCLNVSPHYNVHNLYFPSFLIYTVS